MSDVSLECRNLMKSFGGVRAVNDVSMSFEAGRVTALIGPNGAGKTTLFHLITGDLSLDSGEIMHRGQRIEGLTPYRIASRGIGRLFQDVRIFGKLTILENVQVAFRNQIGENPAWSLLCRPAILRQERVQVEKAKHWLQLVGLNPDLKGFAADLSYGQQKLLAISRLLAAGADVFLLDEPTAGVSPPMVNTLLEIIRYLASDGKTVVVIEHDMKVVSRVADQVHFMVEGQVVASGQPTDILTDRDVRISYLGL